MRKYGIGNNEYGFYKTYDNGKTWEFLKEGNGDTNTVFDRVIIYGKENDGLKYTDDNFATINNSNIVTGSWMALQNSEDAKNIYATSLDGDGIYASKDYGENWERIASGTGDKIKETEDGKIIIYGNGGGDNDKNPGDVPTDKNTNDNFGKDTTIIEKNDNDSNNDNITIPNSTFNPNLNELLQMLFGGMSTEDCLIYILNNIILPGLCDMLTGFRSLKDLNSFYNNETYYLTYYTDGDVFNTNTKGIDFISDVGMKPFSANDIKDYNNVKKEAENIIISSISDDKEINLLELLEDENSKMSITFKIIDMLLSINKKHILKALSLKINKRNEYYEGLDNKEDKASLSSFYEIAKGSQIAIITSIVETIFNFSYSKKIALLKTSIMEAASGMKSSINLGLNTIKELILKGLQPEEILKNKAINNIFNFDLKKEWSKSIRRCIIDYYKICSNNINNISKNEDKEYISEAASMYNDIRHYMLVDTYGILENILVNTFEINNTNELITEKINNLESDIKSAINLYANSKLTDEEFDKEIDILFQEYVTEEKDILKKAESSYSSAMSELKEKFSISLKEKIQKMSENLKAFNKEDFEELESIYSSEEIEKIYKYYKEILSEYIKRCIKLLEYVYEKILEDTMYESYVSIKISSYIDSLKLNKYDSDFLSNFNLNYFKNLEKENSESFIKCLKLSWYNMRDKI